jgi:putative aldouronate transport system substrate-binding protein
MLPDGINASTPNEQPQEFLDSLASDLKDCFTAYGYSTYIDWVGTNPEPGPWYPMYSYSNTMTTSTPGGTAWIKMGETKHEWLPRVVMSEDFESGWEDYMKAYNSCKPDDFLAEMQTELDRRIALAANAE